MRFGVGDQRLYPVAPDGGVHRPERHVLGEAVADHLLLATGQHRVGQFIDSIARRIQPFDRCRSGPVPGSDIAIAPTTSPDAIFGSQR